MGRFSLVFLAALAGTGSARAEGDERDTSTSTPTSRQGSESPTASDFPLARISGTFVPESAVTFPSAIIDAFGTVPEARLTVGEVNAELNLPLRLATRTALIVGAQYRLLLTNQAGGGTNFEGRSEFHSPSVSLSLVHEFDDQWRLFLQGGGGLSGDLAEFESSALRFTFVGVGSYRLTPDLILGLGAMTTYRFGELVPLPTLLVDWWAVPGLLQLKGLLPITLELRWLPLDRVELGLQATVDGGAYALSSASRRSVWPCAAEPVDNPASSFDETVADPSRCFEQLAYSTVEVGPYVGVRLAGELWLRLAVSAPARRRYEFKNADGEVADVGEFNVEPNIVVFAGLEFRLPSRDQTPPPPGRGAADDDHDADDSDVR